jgi:glyoxylase-like metal-dependent hydrolase (beta-lactamase superfamily II)
MFRRSVVLSALATPGLVGGARAQTAPQPPAGAPMSQAPGVYRFKVGSFLVTMVHDGYSRRPVEGLVRNAPVEEVKAVLAESFLPTTYYDGVYTVPFIQAGRHLLAFDCGTGGQMSPTSGQMAANMRVAGIKPEDVTHVVQTHFHGDHINGLTTADNVAVFPNAEIVVPEVEWAWWTGAGNETRSPEGQRGNFANTTRRFAPYAGRIRHLAAGAEVVPGVRAQAAYGHTPGHTLFHVADGSQQLLVLADTTHRPELFVRRPDYYSLFEFDAAMAAQTRKQVLDQVATDRVQVVGYHFPFPATGFIGRDGSGLRYVPASWSATV